MMLAIWPGRQLHAQPSAREGSFTSAGLTLHYLIQGQGTPVVLLSGGPGLEATYLQPVADMIATNHTAILLEQRGTGRSIPITLDASSVNEALLVDDLEALRASLGYKRWTLLGHSFGTFTAMHYAIAHPAQTQSLILLATAPPRSVDDHFFDNMAARSTPEAKRRLEQIKLLTKTASVEDRKKLNEEAGMIWAGTVLL